MGAVLRREWLRFLRAMGRAGLVRFIAIYFIVFGFVLPSSFDDPSAALAVFAVIPLYVAGPLAVDAFAGERERKTLETLLTAPLSSSKLLAGKALFPMITALVTTWSVMVLFTVWTAIRGVMLPGPGTFAAVILGGVFSASLGAVTGLHVSMKAKTVRSGQQWFSVTLLALVLGIPLALNFLLPQLPKSLLVSVAELFDGGLDSPGVLSLAALGLLICTTMWLSLQRRVKGLWTLNPSKGRR